MMVMHKLDVQHVYKVETQREGTEWETNHLWFFSHDEAENWGVRYLENNPKVIRYRVVEYETGAAKR